MLMHLFALFQVCFKMEQDKLESELGCNSVISFDFSMISLQTAFLPLNKNLSSSAYVFCERYVGAVGKSPVYE